MNKVILMGRLTRDPEVRYSAGDNSMAIARYILGVDRRGRRSQDGDQGQTADSAVTAIRVPVQILSAAWHSAEVQNLQKNIFVRVRRS